MAHQLGIPWLWTNSTSHRLHTTQLTSDEYNDTITLTKPHEIIAITSILPVSRESVYRSELTDDTHLTVYAVST